MNSMLEKISKVDKTQERIELVDSLIKDDANMLNVLSVGAAAVLANIEEHHTFDQIECMEAYDKVQEFVFKHINDKLGGTNIAIYALARILMNLVDMYDKANDVLDKMAKDGSLTDEDLTFLATSDSALVEVEKVCKAVMASKDPEVRGKSSMAAKNIFNNPSVDKLKYSKEIKRNAVIGLYKDGVMSAKEVAELIKENKAEVSDIYSKLDKEDFDKIMKELSSLENNTVSDKKDDEDIPAVPINGGIKINVDDLPEGLKEILGEAIKNNDARIIPIKVGDEHPEYDVVSKILNDVFNK